MKLRLLCFSLVLTMLSANPASAQWSVLARGVSKLFKPAAKNSYKMARSTYKIPKSTLHTIPQSPSPTSYTSVIPDNPNSFSYSTDLNSYLKKNSLVYGTRNQTDFFSHLKLRESLDASVIRNYHEERISSAQKYLKSKGYLDSEVSGVWDNESQKALIRYHTVFTNKLKSYPSSTLKSQALKEFNSAIPKELLSKAFTKNRSYKLFVEKRYYEKITVLQSNLKKLKYYNGKVDGLYGPNSHKARRAFEKDFNLTNTKYDFVYTESDRIAHIEIKDGNDFMKYWSKQSDNLEAACSPSFCISNDNVAMSINCNDQTLGITTKGEITISATNGTDTFEHTFNKQQSSNSPCDTNWKVCLSKDPNVDVSICNVSINASSAGQVKISAKSGNRSKSISLF